MKCVKCGSLMDPMYRLGDADYAIFKKESDEIGPVSTFKERERLAKSHHVQLFGCRKCGYCEEQLEM